MTIMQTLPQASPRLTHIAQWIRTLDAQSVPAPVLHTAKLLVLDLIGVLVAASKLDAARIAREHAAMHWCAGAGAPTARMLLDGRAVSLSGFGFAMATQIDNLDAHDGWQPSKGHAGAALFPALCAFAQAQEPVSGPVSGAEALLAMVLGYEIGYRAAQALHSTVEDYHTSGAWNALGCVAIGARLRGLDETQLRDALGIAEYHGPRSQMMREIANPSMLHDGTGWGAPVGIYATLIAQEGFRGAPAATIEFDDAADAWQDLGQHWLTTQQYIKPYPICRWAHAPIDAALGLRKAYDLTPEMIDQVQIHTFAYSAELGSGVPTASPAAQYSLAWPVAAALVRGQVGVDEILETSFDDPAIVALTHATTALVDPSYEAHYPARRLAKVVISLKDGRMLDSDTTEASGGPDPQPTEQEVVAKYRAFAGTVLPAQRVAQIETAVLSLDQDEASFSDLLDLLVEPPPSTCT